MSLSETLDITTEPDDLNMISLVAPVLRRNNTKIQLYKGFVLLDIPAYKTLVVQ